MLIYWQPVDTCELLLVGLTYGWLCPAFDLLSTSCQMFTLYDTLAKVIARP